jgi:hypothetical protein
LRQVMGQHIRDDDLPNGVVLGETLRLVPVASPGEPLSLESAEQRGRIVTLASVASLSRARERLRMEFPDPEQVLGGEVAAFLKPDCVLDETLTQQARAKQVGQLAVADHFDAGQVVARRGQVVDKKLRAALEQLHTRTAVGSLSQQIAIERGLVQRIREYNLWLLATLIGVSLISGLAVWQLARRRPEGLRLSAVAGAPVAGPPAAGDTWRQRALDAESRAEKAYAMMRENLAPHLAQTLKEAIVQGLASQRSELLAAQQKAALEISELVRRLDDLQAPVQDRLRTYEKRIEDLEKALAAKSEEYRELLKLKIEMTRRQAEAERANKPPGAN